MSNTAEASLDADVEVFDVPEAARGAGAAPEPDTREHTIEEVFDEQATLICDSVQARVQGLQFAPKV